jgi:DNA-binding transcriptional MocR family regulator
MTDMIDLSRVTAPATPALEEAFAAGVGDLVARNPAAALMRHHRYLGTDADKAAAAAWLGLRLGAAPEPARCFATNGTQSALFLLLAQVVGAGGVLLAEALSYGEVERIAGLLGIATEPVAIDGEGLDPDDFARACRRPGAKALYCVPTIHNPTAAVMLEERRQAIAAIARRHGIAIIEDEAQGVLAEGAPPPFAAIAPEIAWTVMGLSKCLAMGLRVAYVAGPSADAIERLVAAQRGTSMAYPNPLTAALAAHLIGSGAALRMLAAVRGEAAQRRRIAGTALAGIAHGAADNALHAWLPAPTQAIAAERVTAARARGVIVRGGESFAVGAVARPAGVRVSLSDAPHAALARALEMLRQMWAA